MISQLDTVTKKLSSSHERCHFDACLSNRSALISLDHSFSPSLYTLGNTFWQIPVIGSGLHHRAYERRSILAARLLINPRKIQKRKISNNRCLTRKKNKERLLKKGRLKRSQKSVGGNKRRRVLVEFLVVFNSCETTWFWQLSSNSSYSSNVKITSNKSRSPKGIAMFSPQIRL